MWRWWIFCARIAAKSRSPRQPKPPSDWRVFVFRRFSTAINDWYIRNMPEFWLRLKPSYQWAFGIAALVLLWVLSGQVTSAFHAQKSADAQGSQAADNGVPRVRVVMLNAQQRDASLTVRGRTQALQAADVRAQVEGVVQAIHFEKSCQAQKGDVQS